MALKACAAALTAVGILLAASLFIQAGSQETVEQANARYHGLAQNQILEFSDFRDDPASPFPGGNETTTYLLMGHMPGSAMHSWNSDLHMMHSRTHRPTSQAHAPDSSGHSGYSVQIPEPRWGRYHATAPH